MQFPIPRPRRKRKMVSFANFLTEYAVTVVISMVAISAFGLLVVAHMSERVLDKVATFFFVPLSVPVVNMNITNASSSGDSYWALMSIFSTAMLMMIVFLWVRSVRPERNPVAPADKCRTSVVTNVIKSPEISALM